jgi:hypothetical protein
MMDGTMVKIYQPCLIRSVENGGNTCAIKCIFLDVDGVLNSMEKVAKCRSPQQLDDAMCARLREIVEQSNAKIVLSTSWRMFDYMVDFLSKKLTEASVIEGMIDIVGRTPSLPHPKQRVDEIR